MPALSPSGNTLSTTERAFDSGDIRMSIVICAYTHDRFDDVVEAVHAVRLQAAAQSQLIVVVDNNASLLADLSKALPANVSIVANRYGQGLSAARNSGIAEATGNLITFIDDDAIVQPGCLDAFARRLAEPDMIGVGAVISARWADEAPAWFPDEFLWVVGCSYMGMARDRVRNLLGAAMCIRREAFDAAGGFASELGRNRSKLAYGCEETEFCIRVAQQLPGRFFAIEPAAQVVHKVSRNRATWKYFVNRCYAEGLSKARLSRLAGQQASLSTERSYITKTLPAAVAKGLSDLAFRGQRSGLLRIAGISSGLAAAAIGYFRGRIPDALASKTQSRPAQPADGGVVSKQEQNSSKASGKPRFTIDGILRRHYVLFSNAGLLALGTAASSALGFVYWWLAARFFPARAVGFAAAAISVMNLIGHVGEIGLGALLMGETHRFRERANAFVSAGLLVSFVCSLVCAAGYLAANTFFAVQLGTISAGAGSDLFFVLGCGLTGLTLVLDQGMVGLLKSDVQLVRNVAFAIIKLVLLALLPVAAVALNESSIFATWIVGQLASITVLAWVLARRGDTVFSAPDVGLLRPLLPTVLGHHILNLANLAPGLLLPFVVTIVLSPTVNAAFYAAWMLISVAYLVPASLATVTYAVGSKDQNGTRSALRASFALSLGFGVVAAALCYPLAGFVLRLFNSAYPAIAAAPLRLLGLSIPIIAVKYHYVAIQRLRNQMAIAGFLVAAGCVLELAGAVFGGRSSNLVGLTLGWLAGLSVETVLMLPVVLRATWPSRRDRLDDRRSAIRNGAQGSRLLAAPVAETDRTGGLMIRAPLEKRIDPWSVLRRWFLGTLWAGLLVASLASRQSAAAEGHRSSVEGFVTARGPDFLLDGRIFRVAGVNNHYLTYGSEAEVRRVLDDAVAMHANVVRTFIAPIIGSLDGKAPTIWNWKSKADTSNLGVNGRYMAAWDADHQKMIINDAPDGIQRIDFLLSEARKRKLRLIIAFGDFWAYTGGAQQMSAWYGGDGRGKFFAEDSRVRDDYKRLVTTIVTRLNPLTGILYRDDPTIFAWELLNEPDITPNSLLLSWITEMAAHDKRIDPNHLLSSGQGSLRTKLIELDIPDIDFGTWHSYPDSQKMSPAQFSEQILEYCDLALAYGKPAILEEFGLRADNPARVEWYGAWLRLIRETDYCAGWLVWRLVGRQDSNEFPADTDQFDIHNDGSPVWKVLRDEASQMTESGTTALKDEPRKE